mmetsp:Transcript_37651/g.86123  ORF Transcript_37651/g.86123 Transcript_37651/m.86123 type:complete len:123 (-) Transcript_37651:104-472(-)
MDCPLAGRAASPQAAEVSRRPFRQLESGRPRGATAVNKGHGEGIEEAADASVLSASIFLQQNAKRTTSRKHSHQTSRVRTSAGYVFRILTCEHALPVPYIRASVVNCSTSPPTLHRQQAKPR